MQWTTKYAGNEWFLYQAIHRCEAFKWRHSLRYLNLLRGNEKRILVFIAARRHKNAGLKSFHVPQVIVRLQKRIRWQRLNLFFALQSSSDSCPKTVLRNDAIKCKPLETTTLSTYFPFSISLSKSMQWDKSLLLFTDGVRVKKVYRLGLEKLDEPTPTLLATLIVVRPWFCTCAKLR